MRTDEELKQLGSDLQSDKIFTTAHIREGDGSLIRSIFMALVFLNEEQTEKLKDDKVEILFEYYHKAGERSINGYPIFMSMQYMTHDEWVKVIEYHDKIKSAIEGI